MALSYKYVLPGGGYAENSIVKEMFDDVKAYVDTFVPSGGAAPVDAQYVTLATNATLTNERVLTGTTSQITITDNGAGSTVVLSLPQNIAVTSSPSFASIVYRAGSGSKITLKPQDPTPFADYTLTLPDSDGAANQVMKSDGNGVLSWTSIVSDIHGTTNQVTVSATTGTVTLSLPQDIATASAPQFLQMMLTGGTSAADLTLKLHDSNNGLYADGATVLEVVVNSTIAAQWDFTTFQFWNTGPIQSGSFKFRDAAGSHPTVTITPPTGFTSYSLVLPSDDGAPNQYLTTDGSGNLSWTNAAGTGTVNTGTANRLAYYAASTAVVSALSAITASRALVSDANGLPTHAATTATELGYVNGVTSAIQTQIDGKANLALSNLASVAVNTSLLPGSDNAIDAGSSSKNLRSVYLKTSLIIQQTGAGTNAITFVAPASVTSHTLTLPSAQGSASTLLQNDGSGNLSWVSVTAAGGATKALDNLASVAINTSLLPGTDNSIDAGSTSKNWRSVYVSTSIKNGATTLATATELGYLTGVTSAIQTQFGLKAPLASPTFTGTVTLPNAAITDTTNQLVLGATRTVTITAPTPATSSRTWTIPDITGNGTFAALEGTQTFSGTKTFSALLTPSAGVKGISTNTAATAGNVGEYVSSYQTFTAFPTNGQYGDITSISLTAGDWDVTGTLYTNVNGGTVTQYYVGISTTSGNSATGLTIGDTLFLFLPGTAASDNSGNVVPFRLSLTTTTTVYLKYRANYSVATPNGAGRISARRVQPGT